MCFELAALGSYDAFRRGCPVGTTLGWAVLNSWYLHMNSLCMAAVAIGVASMLAADDGNDFDVAQESVEVAAVAALLTEPGLAAEAAAAILAAAAAAVVVPEIEIGFGVEEVAVAVTATAAAEAPGNFEHFEFGSQTCYSDLS